MDSEKVTVLVRDIEALAKDASAVGASADLFDKYNALCLLTTRSRDAIGLLSAETQGLIVHVLSRFSRSKSAFAQLAKCRWNLSIPKLTDHFGHAPLASRDFIDNLARLAKVATATTTWEVVWSHIQAAQRERQDPSLNSHYRRGVIIKAPWVPNDIIAAAEALGFSISRLKRKAIIAATPPVTPKEARAQDSPDHLAANVGPDRSTPNQGKTEITEEEEPPSASKRRRYSQVELPRNGLDADLSEDGFGDYGVPIDYESSIEETMSNHGQDGNDNSLFQFGELAPTGNSSPVATRCDHHPAESSARHGGVGGSISYKVGIEGHRIAPVQEHQTCSAAQPILVSPSTPAPGEESVAGCHTIARLKGTCDDGWLGHADFDNVLARILPPNFSYREVPDHERTFDWKAWGVGRPNRVVASSDPTFCIVHDRARMHWVMLAFDPVKHQASEYDSLRSEVCTMEEPARHIAARVLGANWEDDHWQYVRMSCPQQEDRRSCGVFALVLILLLITKRVVPEHIDSEMWRDAIARLVTATNTSPPPSPIIQTLPEQHSILAIVRRQIKTKKALEAWLTNANDVVSVFSDIKMLSEATFRQVSNDPALNILEDLERIMPYALRLCQTEQGECSCTHTIDPTSGPLSQSHTLYRAQHRDYSQKVLKLRLQSHDLETAIGRMGCIVTAYEEASRKHRRVVDDIQSDLVETMQVLGANHMHVPVTR